MTTPTSRPDRNLALELVRVTEAGALAAARWIGRGDKEAADGAASVKEAQVLRPDVVIMDLTMPGVDGLEATRRIGSAVPDVPVLVQTMHDDEDTLV